MNVIARLHWILPCLMVMTAISGCGKRSGLEMGRVNGRVTLDGKPLADALVTFIPDESVEHASTGITNERGDYSLSYTYDNPGALVGEHHVKINSPAKNDESPKDTVLPASYNTNTLLTAVVKSGRNRHDFNLTSDGRISNE